MVASLGEEQRSWTTLGIFLVGKSWFNLRTGFVDDRKGKIDAFDFLVRQGFWPPELKEDAAEDAKTCYIEEVLKTFHGFLSDSLSSIQMWKNRESSNKPFGKLRNWGRAARS
jgi:hypothetical protein